MNRWFQFQCCVGVFLLDLFGDLCECFQDTTRNILCAQWKDFALGPFIGMAAEGLGADKSMISHTVLRLLTVNVSRFPRSFSKYNSILRMLLYFNTWPTSN